METYSCETEMRKTMKTEKNTTRMLVLSGMFAAVLGVLSQIQIPMPSGVPVTLQTFAVALTGYVLGWKFGLVSSAAWILLGAAGVPVFSQFSGGVGVLVGATGGFIWGFPIMAAFCGYGYAQKPVIFAGTSLAVFSQFSGGVGVLVGATGGFIWGFPIMAAFCGYGYAQKPVIFAGTSLAGLAVCHLMGVLQFSAVMDMKFGQAFLLASLPYLVKDVLSLVGAYAVARAVRSGLRAAGISLVSKA